MTGILLKFYGLNYLTVILCNQFNFNTKFMGILISSLIFIQVFMLYSNCCACCVFQIYIKTIITYKATEHDVSVSGKNFSNIEYEINAFFLSKRCYIKCSSWQWSLTIYIGCICLENCFIATCLLLVQEFVISSIKMFYP